MNKAQEAVRKAADAVKGGLPVNELADLLIELGQSLKTEPQQTYSIKEVADAKRKSVERYRKAGQQLNAKEIEQSMAAAGYAKVQGTLESGETKWFLKTKNSQIIHIKNNQFSVKNGENVVMPRTDLMHLHTFLKQ